MTTAPPTKDGPTYSVIVLKGSADFDTIKQERRDQEIVARMVERWSCGRTYLDDHNWVVQVSSIHH